MLGRIQTEAYESCSRQSGDLIMCSLNELGQKSFQAVSNNYFDRADMSEIYFSITPILHYSWVSIPEHPLGKHNAGVSEARFFNLSFGAIEALLGFLRKSHP